MDDCLFCKIVAGHIPATVVAENDRYLAFRDISPEAPVHVLVIPRAHVTSLDAADDEVMMGGLLLFAAEVARSEQVHQEGYRVVLNTNARAGQTVFHVHAHVLGGRDLSWPPG